MQSLSNLQKKLISNCSLINLGILVKKNLGEKLSKICIYTHNSRLFYLITKKFKEHHLHFTALDTFESFHPTARVLITTQADIDKFDPELPINADTLIIFPDQNPDEILLQTLQHLHEIKKMKSISVAIDPGMEKTGLAIFLDKRFLFSISTYNLEQAVYWIRVSFTAFPILHRTIKIGNGYRVLTLRFLRKFFSYFAGLDPFMKKQPCLLV